MRVALLSRRHLKRIAYAVVLIVLLVVVYEFIGQNYVFRNRLYFVDNIDHRMVPNSAENINSDGIRSTVEANIFQDENTNIVFLGDSFVYGWKVEIEESIPFMLEAKLNENSLQDKFQVANFGWASSSPLLSYRLLKDIGKKYKPDWVFLAIDMSDFHDDIKYQFAMERRGLFAALDIAPISLLTLRKAASRMGPMHEWLFGFPGRKFFISDAPLPQTRQHFEFTQRNIDAISEFVTNELQARFVLFVLPRTYQYSDRECPDSWEQGEYENLGKYAHEPFVYFEELKASGVDYPIFSLRADFQNSAVFPTAFANDPHWNHAGNQVAVDAIYDYFQSLLNQTQHD